MEGIFYCIAIMFVVNLIVVVAACMLSSQISQEKEKLMPTEYWDAAGEYPEDYEEENDAVTER